MFQDIFEKIASARSRKVRGTFTQPDFMDSCLSISHTCFRFLPSRQVSPCAPGVNEGSEDAKWV